MLITFQGRTANDVWLQAYRHVRTKGLRQESRSGPTRELLHTALSINDPRQRWILARRPALNTALAIADVIWIATGRNDRRFLSYWSNTLSDYVGNARELHGAYGHRLIRHFGFNQLMRAARALESCPDSRQVVLQIWDPLVDMPSCTGRPRSRDIPCNVISMVKIRSGKLEWMQIMRSNDLFRGLPYNLVQFTTLQEIVAGWLGIPMGSFNQVSDSLHLYEKDVAQIRIADPGEVISPDSLALPMSASKIVLGALSRTVDRMIAGTTSSSLRSQIRWTDLPRGYHNLLLILIAEQARKKGWPDLMTEAISGCSNPALATSWALWRDRVKNRNQKGARQFA